jgi:Kef-type K+ transport system membrane component KefB/nucleotide-binding universal stress UspA family protein
VQSGIRKNKKETSMSFLLTLIIQIAIIIIVSRVIGLFFRKIHQPQVVGEMVAGIILGPSLLGWLAPNVSAIIFPAASLKFLNTLSQIGLLMFMFIIGLEFDPKLLKGRGHAAVLISHVSIILPFLLGTLIALYLYPLLSSKPITFTAFALFMGASMSITAFPVLARILSEKNLIKTKIGSVTIACAAIDDVTAWSILALVVAIVRAGSNKIPFWMTISGAVLFILLMIFMIRPIVSKLEVYYENKGNKLTNDILGLVLLLMLASAWTTEWLGIHALFGAFFMGAMMPRNKEFLNAVTEKLNDVTIVLFLPIFFALTGLNTSIGLINGTEMWSFFGLILAAAVIGKMGGSTIAAKVSALHWRESVGLGILMNTRGLMELIILSIGLELGVISHVLFTMMVMMALVTTFMTTPFFEWVYPRRLLRKELEEIEKENQGSGILISVSFPSSGPGLLKLASSIISNNELKVYALHLIKSNEISLANLADDSSTKNYNDAFKPLMKFAAENSINVSPISFPTRNAAQDIISIAGLKGAGIILMGWHKPILTESILSGTVNEVMRNAKADVCVYLERQFNPYKNILVPFRDGVHDKGALALAHQIAVNIDAQVTVLHIVKPKNSGTPDSGVKTQINESAREDVIRAGGIEDFPEERIKLRVVESNTPLDTTMKIANRNFDLVVVGLSETWGLEPSLFSKRHERLARECPASLLILRKYVPLI